MKRRKKWRPAGRPKQMERSSRSRSKQLLKEMAKSAIPGKGEQDYDANPGVHTAGAGEYGRSAA